MVASLGAIDLSSFITARTYVKKIECERDVKAAVSAMRMIYPTLQIKAAVCLLAQ